MKSIVKKTVSKYIKHLKNLLETSDKPLYVILLAIFTFYLLLIPFRSVIDSDEHVYLRETLLMSKLISSGIWIGDYGVGLHGFLFKIIPAILFNVFVPSIEIATIFNMVLSICSLYLFFKILFRIFKSRVWSLFGILLLGSNYIFFTFSITFLREIPMIFVLLLIMYFHLYYRKDYIIGLLLLLLLDAKEYAFYVVAPSYLLWVIFDEQFIKRNNIQQFINNVKTIIKRYILLLTPSIIYIMLMLYTSVIPLNIFNASIVGVVEGDGSWNLRQFSPDKSLRITKDSENKGVLLAQEIVYSVNAPASYPLRYVLKMLLPSSISFTTLPLFIVVPAFYFSFVLYRQWKSNNRDLLVFIFILWINIVLFLFRSAIGRYMFAAFPVFIVLFLYYLKDAVENRKIMIITILITGVTTTISLLLESNYAQIKTILQYFLIIFITVVFWAYTTKKWYRYVIRNLYIIAVIVVFSAVSIYAIYDKQIRPTLLWGSSYECKAIFRNINKDDTIWVADIGWRTLPSYCRNEAYVETQYKWQLKEWVPKKSLLKVYETQKTFIFDIGKMAKFKKDIFENSIERLVLVKSILPNHEMQNADYLELLKNEDWLLLENIATYQNKLVYTYTVLKN